MLPDFPRAKEPVVRQVTKALRELVNRRPLVAMFQRHHFHEGRGWAGYGADASAENNRWRRMEVPSELPTTELIEEGPAALFKRLPVLADAMGSQLEQHMMQRIAEAAKAGGPVMEFESVPATCDEHLERLARFPIEFDDDGKPHLPGILAPSPEYIAKLREWERDPNCQAKLAELIARKREEYDARESNRRLVD